MNANICPDSTNLILSPTFHPICRSIHGNPVLCANYPTFSHPHYRLFSQTQQSARV
jgi:hypothetical protein